MDKELNKETLLKAIISLKQYSANPEIWLNINKQLDRDELRMNLKKYQAPTELWDTISGELDNQRAIRNIRSIALNYLKIAASISLILFAGWYFPKNIFKSNISTEMVTLTPKIEFGNQYEQVKEACARKQIICEQERIQALMMDLKELETVQIILKKKLKGYSNETRAYMNLEKIEKEKNQIVNQIYAII